MAGQGECCTNIASVLFYIEAWNRVNEKLSCTQVKCSWLMPRPVKEVPYAPVSDIAFRSEKKLKQNLDQTMNGLTSITELNSCKACVSEFILSLKLLFQRAETYQPFPIYLTRSTYT